jgi:hypothetical protein
LIAYFEKNLDSEFGRVLLRLLDEYVVRAHDRMLFSFLPEPDEPGAARDHSDDPGSEFIRAGREAGAPPPAL